MPSELFTPFKLRSISIDNRIVVGPMDMYSANDGCASDYHLMHYGRFAISGVGLIVSEAAHVERRGRVTHACLGLYSDENERALERVVKFCKAYGSAHFGVQISHAGRKGSTRIPAAGGGGSRAPEFLRPYEEPWPTVSCSAQPRAPGWPAPEALDEDGMRRILDAHVEATRRAARSGAQLLEFVAAHGYLMHQFLSPLSNERNDEFGGNLENRMRYPLQVFKAVREAWPAGLPISVRISATDWVEGGWDPEQSVVFSRKLKELGCDVIAVSSGGLSLNQEIILGEGHQVEFSSQIRRESGVPTMAMGMIFDPHHAENIIARGDADFVALARTMLVDPNWAWGAAAVLDAEVGFPRQLLRGYRSKWHRAKLKERWVK